MDNVNIQMVFDKMKKFYFGPWLDDIKCVVIWDVAGIISDDSNYKIFSGQSFDIVVSLKTIVRPRIQLISLLLHVLIHLYVTKISKQKIAISHHGPEFRNLMHFFNSRIETKITTGHVFLYTSEESQYPNQWWQCTGICSNYQPFYGVIRCPVVPNEAMNFWQAHHKKCGGSFFKIFEAERHLGNGTVEKKFVRNANYMNPRPKFDDPQNSLPKKTVSKTASQSLQVRAQIDLTDDVPQEQNLCAVINLDESEFVIDDDIDDEEKPEDAMISQVKSFCDKIMKSCFLCMEIVGESRLASHIDSCTGFQQQVAFDLRKITKSH